MRIPWAFKEIQRRQFCLGRGGLRGFSLLHEACGSWPHLADVQSIHQSSSVDNSCERSLFARGKRGNVHFDRRRLERRHLREFCTRTARR